MRAVKLRVIRPAAVRLPWHRRPAARRMLVVVQWVLVVVAILGAIALALVVANVLTGVFLVWLFSRVARAGR
jgi:hypothetical protein